VEVGAGEICVGSGEIGAIVSARISDQWSYWSDNILLFFVVNIYFMPGLLDQLGQRQETPGIKDRKLAFDEVGGARVGLVCPIFWYGESAS
jgi:hypothetical protein